MSLPGQHKTAGVKVSVQYFDIYWGRSFSLGALSFRPNQVNIRLQISI